MEQYDNPFSSSPEPFAAAAAAAATLESAWTNTRPVNGVRRSLPFLNRPPGEFKFQNDKTILRD
jgi:hypothetical protein